MPQEHNICVQSVCPSFLKRKRQAADVLKHLLTKDDCRLLINYGPINNLINNIPSAMITPDDVLVGVFDVGNSDTIRFFLDSIFWQYWNPNFFSNFFPKKLSTTFFNIFFWREIFLTIWFYCQKIVNDFLYNFYLYYFFC